MSGITAAQIDATWLAPVSGAWTDASRWSTNPSFPNFDNPSGSEYRAIFAAVGSAHTVSIDQALRIRSVLINSSACTISHNSGVFTLDTTMSLNTGVWRLNGGTVRGGTLAFGSIQGRMTFSSNAGNTLDGVTIQGSTVFADNSSRLTIRNGLTLTPGTVLSLGGVLSRLDFAGSQTLSGGTLRMGYLGVNSALSINSSDTLSIASGSVVDGGGTLSGGAGSSLSNAGTIDANSFPRSLTLSPSSISNSGTLRASVNTLNILAPVVNTGTIEANGGSVNLQAGVANSGGSIFATNGGAVTILGNVSTPGLGNLQTSAGGLIRLSCDLNNAGSVIQIGNSSLSWEFTDAVIRGGTLDTGLSATIRQSGRLTLDGVSVTSNVVAQPTAPTIHTLSVRGSTTFGGTLQFPGGGTLEVDDPSTSLATETQFSGQSWAYLGASGSAAPVIPAGKTLRASQAATLDIRSWVASGGTLTNRGTIIGSGTGTVVRAFAGNAGIAGTFVNEGTIALDSGATLILGEPAGSGTPAKGWRNTGSISVLGGIAILQGGFTGASLANANFAGSQVTMGGEVDNTNSLLVVSRPGESWSYQGALVRGGLLRFANGIIRRENSSLPAITLDNVTIDGNVSGVEYSGQGIPSSPDIVVTNGLGASGVVRLTRGVVLFQGDQAIRTGTFELRSGTLAIAPAPQTTGVLTINPGVTVFGVGSIDRASLSDRVRIVNQGTIRVDRPGGLLVVSRLGSNSGTLHATNGGWLVAVSPEDGSPAVNNGIIRVDAGGVLVLGNTRFDPGTQWQRGAGSVLLQGMIDNTAMTLTLDASSGYLAPVGGGVRGGVVNIGSDGGFNLSSNTVFNNQYPISTSGTQLTLDNVTINGDIQQPRDGKRIAFGRLALNGTLTVRADGGLRSTWLGTDTDQRIDGGTIVLDSTLEGTFSNRATFQMDAGSQLTLSPTTIVRGGGRSGNAIIGTDFQLNSPQSTTIVNQGIIRADRPGDILALRPNRWVNTGVIEAVNGGVLETPGFSNLSWDNSGGILRIRSGGEIRLGGRYTPANFGTVDNQGGTLRLGGEMNIGGGVFNVTPSMGVVDFSLDGTIRNGTVNVQPGATLRATSPARLNNITLNGELGVGEGGMASFGSTLTLNGTVRLQGPRAVARLAQPSLPGGTFVFEGTGDERSLIADAAVILGVNTLVRGGNGLINGSASRTIRNEGRISADVAGQAIRINQSGFTNAGIVEAINGGQIVFVPPSPLEPAPPIFLTGITRVDAWSTLVVQGTFAPLASSLIDIAFANSDAELVHSRVSAESFQFAGSLRVSGPTDAPLSPGTRLRVFEGGSYAGSFSRLDLPALPNGWSWDTSSLHVDGSIGVVPAPGAVGVLCGALGLSLVHRRRSISGGAR